MDTFDWNDLRYVIAVTRKQSAAGAARELGVSHATVLRRIQALEQGVGTPLFYRRATGYEPTEAGQQLADVGASIENAVAQTRRAIDETSSELAGSIRFTTTDSLATALMPAVLKRFHDRYPNIKVEMIATNARLDLDRRDADVALRPTGRPPASWVGKPLADLRLGLYAAKDYLKERSPQAWQAFDWVVPSGSLAQPSVIEWLNLHVDEAHKVMRADSFVALRELALQGIGATILPQFMGRHDGLTLLHTLPSDVATAPWLLTHINLRHTRRINVFMEHVTECVRAILEENVAPTGAESIDEPPA